MKIGLAAAGIVILLTFIGTSYYIALRVFQIAGAYLRTEFVYGIVAIIVVASIVLLLRFIIPLRSGGKTLKHLINWLSSYWMGIYIYLLIFFGLADLLVLVGKITGVLSEVLTESIHLHLNLAAVCITAILAVYGIYHAGKIDKVSYEVQISEDTNEEIFRIALISDLHLGALTSEEKLPIIIDEIKKMNPDIVCIAGDIFDTDYETIQNPGKAAAELGRLTDEYRVYACLGNHDAGVTFEQMEAFLKKCHIRCLNEEYVTVDNRINLLGRVDAFPIGAQGNYIRTDTKKLLDTVDNPLPVVVLEHNPSNLPQYNEKADLVLCGHTHHGQVWPVNWITKYGYYPKKGEIPQAIVTSGVGVWGLPMRIRSSCEIADIRLR